MKAKHLLTTTTTAILLAFTVSARGQCTEVLSGLRLPTGSTLSNQGNLIIAEHGTATPRSGRISVVDSSGNRRTLIDGMPTGPSDVGDPSGPSGVFMRGRSLYVAMGVGNVAIRGPVPGTAAVNPNGPSSPIFSSVLLVQFSAAMEQTTTGVTMTAEHEQALANGQTVNVTANGRDWITIRRVVDFPNFVPAPLPTFADNIAVSNPFDLVALGDTLYVSDGGRDRVWQVDLLTGNHSTLAAFPPIPNPLFGGGVGGPVTNAVPTGITTFRGQVLTTLFRGAPFAPGTSSVQQIDPVTGGATQLISGLKTAIDVIPSSDNGDTSYLVLQSASTGPFFGGPGQLMRFDSPAGPPTLVANCLTFPTSMTLDSKRGALYVTEFGGRLVRLAVERDGGFTPALRNISARGQVGTGENVLIAGFIIEEGTGGAPAEVVVRAIAPSLSNFGVADPLQDTVLTIHGANGEELTRNDNWRGDAGQPSQQAEIQASGLAPTNDAESAIIASFPPGHYTAIVRGKGNDAGVALVEVYHVQ